MRTGVALAFAVATAVAACGGTSNSMKSWVGSSDAELVSQWGAPDRETSLSSGGRVLTWNGRNMEGTILCHKSFTVDAQHVVRAWSHNCPL